MLGKKNFSDVMNGLVNRLQMDAQDRMTRRRQVETRWIADMNQYEGREDPDIISRLSKNNRTQTVINTVRPHCNTYVSKISDLLFPTDDRNWGINPTPVPELDVEMSRLDGMIRQLTEKANMEKDDAAAAKDTGEGDAMAQRMAEIESMRQEARQKADLMAEEISDNLVECHYAHHCRAMIHDATVFGTGIIKGPIPLSDRVRRNWVMEPNGSYKMSLKEDRQDRFSYRHVSFWNLFPDPDARTFDQVESWMERYIMRPRDMRQFARQPGVDAEAVRRVLRAGPQDDLPYNFTEIDRLSDDSSGRWQDNVFVLWEYRGPLDEEEMREVMVNFFKDSHMMDEDIDPLLNIDVVIYFCQNEILKIGINHMDTNAEIYSIFQIEKSPSMLWSFGLPRLMRAQSNILTDAWRDMIDNARFAGLPNLEVNSQVLQRADGGDNVVEPGATWVRRPGFQNEPGLVFHTIPIQQQHYAEIIRMSMEFMESETNMSALAKGEQGSASRTAGGMALLMNSVNIVFRRIVKEFDDSITTPVITKAYDFLMQFSERPEIKGDYAIQARGSSVLLVREVQSQNLLLLATQLSLHPVLGRQFKMRELAKSLLQSMMLPTDGILKTTQELAADEAAEREAEERAPPDPAILKLRLDAELAQLASRTRLAVEEMRQRGSDTRSTETMLARLEGIMAQIGSRERMLAAEAAVEGRNGRGGGSGGYFSG